MLMIVVIIFVYLFSTIFSNSYSMNEPNCHSIAASRSVHNTVFAQQCELLADNDPLEDRFLKRQFVALSALSCNHTVLMLVLKSAVVGWVSRYPSRIAHVQESMMFWRKGCTGQLKTNIVLLASIHHLINNRRRDTAVLPFQYSLNAEQSVASFSKQLEFIILPIALLCNLHCKLH